MRTGRKSLWNYRVALVPCVGVFKWLMFHRVTTDRKSKLREKSCHYFYIYFNAAIDKPYYIGCFKKLFRFDGISSLSIHEPGFLWTFDSIKIVRTFFLARNLEWHFQFPSINKKSLFLLQWKSFFWSSEKLHHYK